MNDHAPVRLALRPTTFLADGEPMASATPGAEVVKYVVEGLTQGSEIDIARVDGGWMIVGEAEPRAQLFGSAEAALAMLQAESEAATSGPTSS